MTQCQNNEEHVIAFASRGLSKAEKNYTTTEKECLACIFACEKFRGYIEGVKFTLVTDHASLKFLYKLKEPSGRLARWSCKLSQFDFEIVHRKGTLMVVPDALSRSPVESPPSALSNEILVVTHPDEIISLDIDLNNLDSYYVRMRTKILESPEKFPQWLVKSNYVYKLIPSRVTLNTNISDWKLLVPKSQRSKIIESCHDDPTASHAGFRKTYSRVLLTYFWPKMRYDVMKYVRNCKMCSAQKPINHSKFGLMGSEKVVRFPWQVIALDLLGPLPRSSSGYQYLLVVSDWFTKYPVLFPLRNAKSQNIVKHLENDVFLVYGVPQTIICDNGRQLVSKEIKKLVLDYGSRFSYTPYYHPSPNFVERWNRTICSSIRCYVSENHKAWDKQLAKIGYALRTNIHEVTGYSPAFLNFGRIVPCSGDYYGKFPSTEILPSSQEFWAKNLTDLKDIYKEVEKRLHTAYIRNSNYYNLRRRDKEFHIGDFVWKRNLVLSDAANDFTKKLAPRYILCKIVGKKSKLVYVLQREDGTDAGTWHIEHLKPYNDSVSTDNESESEAEEELTQI